MLPQHDPARLRAPRRPAGRASFSIHERSAPAEHRPSELSAASSALAIARAVANAPAAASGGRADGNLDPKTATYVFSALEGTGAAVWPHGIWICHATILS